MPSGWARQLLSATLPTHLQELHLDLVGAAGRNIRQMTEFEDIKWLAGFVKYKRARSCRACHGRETRSAC